MSQPIHYDSMTKALDELDLDIVMSGGGDSQPVLVQRGEHYPWDIWAEDHDGWNPLDLLRQTYYKHRPAGRERVDTFTTGLWWYVTQPKPKPKRFNGRVYIEGYVNFENVVAADEEAARQHMHDVVNGHAAVGFYDCGATIYMGKDIEGFEFTHWAPRVEECEEAEE